MTTMGTSRLAGALAPEFRDPLLAALLTEAPAATVVVDEGGHIVHANQAFLDLHHLSSKDTGRHLRDASIDLWIQLGRHLSADGASAVVDLGEQLLRALGWLGVLAWALPARPRSRRPAPPMADSDAARSPECPQ